MAEYKPVESGTILSSGPTNATINTYKPESVKDNFIITIVNEGKTYATIHVTEDSIRKSTYILKGNTPSLTLFEFLCGKDIDKRPYLMFDGKPATLPKGFKMTEEDPRLTFPSVRTPAEKASSKVATQRYYAFNFDDILAELQEAEKQPAGTGAAKGPPKTIVLLVSMHGARLESMPLSPTLPINETYAYAPGECPKLKVSTVKQMERIEKYRQRNVYEILDGYAEDVPDKEKDKIGRYSVLFDQHYQCDSLNNPNVFSNGIFVLGSNFFETELFQPVELPGKMTVEYSQFPTTLYEPETAMALQKINLINIPVLEELSRRVTGKTFALEHLNVSDPYFRISLKDTGIPHYFDSKLSHYLTYCQRLGAEKVVLIDETCRIRSVLQGIGAEEAGEAESLGPGKLISRPYTRDEMRDPRAKITKSGDYGGRRTRRTRRRSRRFHKKS